MLFALFAGFLMPILVGFIVSLFTYTIREGLPRLSEEAVADRKKEEEDSEADSDYTEESEEESESEYSDEEESEEEEASKEENHVREQEAQTTEPQVDTEEVTALSEMVAILAKNLLATDKLVKSLTAELKVKNDEIAGLVSELAQARSKTYDLESEIMEIVTDMMKKAEMEKKEKERLEESDEEDGFVRVDEIPEEATC